MKKKSKRTLTPKLRFPEFRERGEWEERKLGEVAVFYKGKGLPKSVITPNGKSQCIHYGELFTEYPEVIETVRSHTNSKEKAFLSLENDVLMPTSDVTPNGLAKACCVKLDNVILGGDILVIRANKKEVNGEFLARLIRHLEQKVLQLVSGSTVFHLYPTSINKLALSFPKTPEQQKIAECLSSLDGLIAAGGRMLEALKAHKKGLMQQLFPQPGQTQPRLRFPEFRDKGGWERKVLSDACLLRAGKFVAASDIREQDEDGLFPCYGGNGLRGFAKSRTHDGIYPLIGRQGALCGNVRLARGEFHATEHAVVATPSKGVHVIWLFYVLDRLNLNQFATGQAQPGLSVDVLEKVTLAVPALEQEQQNIADCLTSLDTRIAAQAAKIETLKQHKRGLMQQLFPAPEEQ